MRSKEELLLNTVYYSGKYFKDLNGGKYGNYRSAVKTIKVKGHFDEIYNYVEDNIHLWFGQVMPVQTAGLDEAMIERVISTAADAQKQAVRRSTGNGFCHYTGGDTEGDIIDITIIKGFWFLKTKVIIKLSGYAGYCKQLITIIEEKIKKQLMQDN